MDSRASSGFDAASSTKSFAPLLIEDSRPSAKSFNRFGQRLWSKRTWKEAGLTAVEDLIAFNWIAAFAWLFVLGWLTGLFLLISLFAQDATGLTDSQNSACQPDGSFNIFAGTFNMWGVSGFFQITLAWGWLTFANAKLIDVAWDVVFGRGGQALLAWISWSVFSDYVTTSIEVSPVTYETFWTFFLQDQPTIFSTWYMIRDFTRSHGLRSRVVMVFMVIVTIYILLFPTLGSAMTGYQANNGAFVSGVDGELVKFSDFDMVAYVIHDGWRVNLTGNFPVTYRKASNDTEQMVVQVDGDYLLGFGSGSYFTSSVCEEGPPTYLSKDSRERWEGQTPLNSRCSMHQNVSSYVKDYGFFGLENKNSTFMNQTLEAPVLNISAFYIPEYYDRFLFGRNWTDPRTKQNPFTDRDEITYVYNMYNEGNQTYKMSYIKSYGSCQPMTEMAVGRDSVRETYQWGFSFVQMYIMLIFLVLWTIGMSAMWLKARMTMSMRGRFDKPRGFKGVLELAAAIRKELQETNPDDLNHGQLSEEIKKRLGGGSIELEKAGSPAMYGLLRGFWAWIKERKWWFTAWVLILPVAIILTTYRWLGYLHVVSFSIFLAMVMGRENKSRAVLLMGWFILGTIVFVAVCSALKQRQKYSPFDSY